MVQQLELELSKPKFNTDMSKKLVFEWDGMELDVKEYLCEIFIINTKIARQPANKLDKWLKCLLIANFERMSCGYATFDFDLD